MSQARRRPQHSRPQLTLRHILAWADAHFARTGCLPTRYSGPIPDSGETWEGIRNALRLGRHGLPNNLTLARLLARHRNAPVPGKPPRLAIAAILRWADAHHARTGKWPSAYSGAVMDAPGETWARIARAFYKGSRGLPAGSLAALLERKRGYRNHYNLPRLTVAQILRWAGEHRSRTGRWPTASSGPVAGAPSEDWSRISTALRSGHRGLERSTLARLLGEHRGYRNSGTLSRLGIPRLLRWGG